MPKVRQPVQGALILPAALDRLAARLSADRPARRAHRPRRGIAVLSRIRIVERTGSTNADCIADRSRRRRRLAGRARTGRGAGPAGPGVGVARRAISTAARWSSCAPGDPPAQTLSLAAGLAPDRSDRRRCSGQPLMLKWPNDVMLLGSKLAGILLERSGDRVAVGFGVNLAAAPDADGPAEARRSAGQCRAAGLRAVARGELRAAARPVARSEPGAARPGLAGARPSARDAADRSFRRRRDRQRPLRRASSPTARCGFAATTDRSRSSVPATSSCERRRHG